MKSPRSTIPVSDLPRLSEPASRSTGAPEDEAILSQIAQGDLQHFDLLVDRHKHRLFLFIRQRIGDHHQAEDLAQETFLRLFRAARRGSYTGQARVITWLFTIAENCVTDHWRASGRRPLKLAGDLTPQITNQATSDRAGGDVLTASTSHRDTPDQAAIAQEAQLRTEALLSTLPDAQRQVVSLKVCAGLTFAEIAEVTGVPLATVKSRMAYGLKKIQEQLSNSGRKSS